MKPCPCNKLIPVQVGLSIMWISGPACLRCREARFQRDLAELRKQQPAAADGRGRE